MQVFTLLFVVRYPNLLIRVEFNFIHKIRICVASVFCCNLMNGDAKPARSKVIPFQARCGPAGG